jgi:GntR family transcriptional repressor for pyruvate dehydrogenase complex
VLKIKKISVIDEVIKTIRNLIASGSYAVGDKLPAELNLCEQLGVGRSTIREAFRVLQATGLIELRTGKGAYVKSVEDTTFDTIKKWFIEKESEVSELMQVRMAIEPVAVRLAIQCGTDKQLRQIKEIHEAFKKAVVTKDSIDLAALDESLHSAIIEASNNVLLVKIGRIMADALIAYRTRSFAVTENIVHACDPHESIVNAILRKDEKSAIKAMQKHLEISLQDMKSVVKK